MEEAVLERIQKDKEDRQWDKYHANVGQKNGKDKPSEKQRAYIAALGRTAGLNVDVSKIEDSEQASRLIERLKLLASRMNGNGFDLRDKRVAFGLATKLVFRRYCEQQKDPTKWKRFWKDVNLFYTAYQKHQELAVGVQG